MGRDDCGRSILQKLAYCTNPIYRHREPDNAWIRAADHRDSPNAEYPTLAVRARRNQAHLPMVKEPAAPHPHQHRSGPHAEDTPRIPWAESLAGEKPDISGHSRSNGNAMGVAMPTHCNQLQSIALAPSGAIPFGRNPLRAANIPGARINPGAAIIGGAESHAGPEIPNIKR